MWIDDTILQHCQHSYFHNIYIPKDISVVLGSSNKAEIECNVESCALAKIPILKRYGGGGTVVLYPGCIVISLGLWVKHIYDNSRYFKLINQAVIDCLSSHWPELKPLSQKGHSDIVYANKKIAGTSIFRSRNYLLYQASLLVDLDLSLIETCLKHPSKEPDYRENKSHKEFLTSLGELTGAGAQEILEQLEGSFKDQIESKLHDELIASIAEQTIHLLNKSMPAQQSRS